MESIAEEWRTVISAAGQFEVSNHGRVRSLPHEVRHWCGRMIPKAGGILKQSPHSHGYRLVSLRDNKKHYVHRLVMEAFVGPADGQDVNHIDGDKSNNRLDNLEYCDRLHNVRHAIRTGLQNNAGEGNGRHVYTTEAIEKAKRLLASGMTQREAARLSGVAESTVHAVATGKRWIHLREPVA